MGGVRLTYTVGLGKLLSIVPVSCKEESSAVNMTMTGLTGILSSDF